MLRRSVIRLLPLLFGPGVFLLPLPPLWAGAGDVGTCTVVSGIHPGAIGRGSEIVSSACSSREVLVSSPGSDTRSLRPAVLSLRRNGKRIFW